MGMLRRVVLKGFKSIREMELELRHLNVLIGANGAGKSNLVSFFKMLNEMMAGRLQNYIAVAGRAHSILHYGPKQTPALEVTLEFEMDKGVATYYASLFHVAGDTLAVGEWVDVSEQAGVWRSVRLITGHRETQIGHRADAGEAAAQAVRQYLN